MGGWGDISWGYEPQYDTIATGNPIGSVQVSNNGMTFAGTFQNGTVRVNCAGGTYEINLQ